MNANADIGWSDERALVAGLTPILTLARDTLGCETVADVLVSPQLPEVLSVAGALDDLRAVRFDGLPPTVGLLESFADRISGVVAEVGADSIAILVHNEVEQSGSLGDLAEVRGVSREHVRKLKRNARELLEQRCGPHATLIAAMVEPKLPLISRRGVVDRQLSALVVPIAANREPSDPVTALARHLVEAQLELSSKCHFVLTKRGAELIEQLVEVVTARADDLGIVDLDTVLADEVPDLVPHRNEVIEMLGLVRMGKRVSLRDTKRARAKAALLDIGRVATKDEIAAASGIPVSRLGGTLSVMDEIVRADKDSWGLVEWVDDVYQGIPAAIEQRVREHNGEVARAFLLDDIAERFAVKRQSVIAYIATPQFETVNGMVRIADADSFKFRPLEEVATWDADGNLLWEFPVEERYRRGYSIVHFPGELANYLGCGPNSSLRVRVSDSPTEAVMISWRLSSIQRGAEIGRARETLIRLGAVGGERARVVMLPDRSIRFELLDQDAGAAPAAHGPESAV